MSVVEDVISNVRESFLDEGVDEQVLQELKQVKALVSKRPGWGCKLFLNLCYYNTYLILILLTLLHINLVPIEIWNLTCICQFK